LRANEEGRGVCRGVPPSLKTSEVYVADGATAQTGSDETPEVGIWAVEASPTLRQVLVFVCVRCRRGMLRHVVLYDRNETVTVCLRLCVLCVCVHVSAVRAAVVVVCVACHV